MSPQCKPSDVLLHADVAIGTHRRLLSIAAAALLFFMSPAGCQGFCFHGHAAVWCNTTQNPPWVPWRDTKPRECYSAIGWHTDWLTSAASHSASWANTIHDPRLLPQSLTGWQQFHATQFHNDSQWFSYLLLLMDLQECFGQETSSTACVEPVCVCFAVCLFQGQGKHDIEG